PPPTLFPYTTLFRSRRPGDAPGTEGEVVLDLVRKGSRGHDIGDRQTAPVFEHTKGLAKDLRFFRREINHTIGDDHIDAGIRHRQVLDLPKPKFYLRVAALRGVRPGFPEHFMRHVHANDPSSLPHGTSG